MRIELFCFITILIFFPAAFLLSAENGNHIDQSADAPGLPEENRETGISGKPGYNFFGESLLIFLPIIDERIKENNEIERNIYPIGVGGSLVYKSFILNRIFSPYNSLPGILLGLSGSFFMMEPKPEYQDRFGELTLLTLGIYTGYQFLLPVSNRVSISPALFGGGRYYISFHFFDNELSIAYNPIIICGLDICMVFDSFFSLSLRGEYQIYLEGVTRQTLNVSLGTGIFF